MASLRASLVFATALIIVGAAAPTATALLHIHINGTVPCGTGLLASSSSNLLPFPNALVQLKCGNNVISSTKTDSNGRFSILMDPVNGLLYSLLSSCKLVVATPLAVCNPSLSAATGLLQSPLMLLGGFGNLLNGIISFIPFGFSFLHP